MPRIKKAASTAYGQLAGGSPGGVITFLSAQMRTSGAAIQWILEALLSALRHANTGESSREERRTCALRSEAWECSQRSKILLNNFIIE